MGEKILVIDDEPLILKTIERALGKVGFEVKTTVDVQGFRQMLSTEGADLVIMDMHMRGVNADALMAEVKVASPETKILVISGSFPGPREGYFLQKPFMIDELRRMVRNILASDR